MVGTSRRQQPDIRAALDLAKDVVAHEAELERLAEATRKHNEAREKSQTAKAEAEQTIQAAADAQAEIDELRADLKAQIERAEIREAKAARLQAQAEDLMATMEAIWTDKADAEDIVAAYQERQSGYVGEGSIEEDWSIN